jgi:catechol 2,3-dioxygenase-like lactoylglutathione lyase family enzyme
MGARHGRRVSALAHQLIGIDHVIVGVRDLEAARAQYARLGFNSTPRGRHVGWGTANYCIMFEHDYLELLGIVDPAQFTNDLDRFLAEREGLLAIALGSRDVAATHAAWAAAGLTPEPPRALGRLLEAEAGAAELRFRNVLLPRDRAGGLSLFACEHLTPALLRRPAWLAHPNGAVAIRSCTVATPNVRRLAEVMGRLFGSAAITTTDNVVAAHTGRGVILMAPPEDARLMHPMVELPDRLSAPCLVALTITVANPDRAADFLALQGIAFERAPSGDVLIAPAEARGVALEFVRG